jgi:hypothetical protein
MTRKSSSAPAIIAGARIKSSWRSLHRRRPSSRDFVHWRLFERRQPECAEPLVIAGVRNPGHANTLGKRLNYWLNRGEPIVRLGGAALKRL